MSVPSHVDWRGGLRNRVEFEATNHGVEETMKSVEIRRPDDWHLHLRDGDVLKAVLPATVAHFGRALVMPNLVPPVVTAADALAYRERILSLSRGTSHFTPFMALYLTEHSSADDVAAGFRDQIVRAVKLYPAGATTNSSKGVSDLGNVGAILERMAEIGMPLCVHGEVTDPQVDVFDREAVFIDRVLEPLRRRLPELRIVLEHVTTSMGVDFVRDQSSNVAATITPHHMMINRNAIFTGGIRPHYYCLPVAKRESQRKALVDAATSGDTRFFLGTDSAPHIDPLKEAACGCAGVFCAPNAIACCAHVFEGQDALDRLEAFTSVNGALFYGVEPADDRVVLTRRSEPVSFPSKVLTGGDEITVFVPPNAIHWETESQPGLVDGHETPRWAR